MAITGVHVLCAVVGSLPSRTGRSGAVVGMLGELMWSETLAAPGTTTKSVPNDPRTPFFLRLVATEASFVAIGPNPDPVNGTRYLMLGGSEPQDFCARPGDKVAWVRA